MFCIVFVFVLFFCILHKFSVIIIGCSEHLTKTCVMLQCTDILEVKLKILSSKM